MVGSTAFEQARAMTDPSPLLSVLMPVHNAAAYLPAALASILQQTFADFEVIAIDDGSDDESGVILDEMAARDVRLRVVHQKNQGIVASLNRVIALARAPLIARMDADDIARPDRFAKQYDYLARHPGVVAVSGGYDVIDGDGKYLHSELLPTLPESIAAELPYRSVVCHPAVMARKAAVQAAGGYRRICQYAEDYDLWLRLSEIGPIANLPDVLLSYRMHADKLTSRFTIAQELAAIAARGAARARRDRGVDPLADTAIADVTLPDYATLRSLLSEVVSRHELAATLFIRTLSRTDDSTPLWSWLRLYMRYGLRDLDAEGAKHLLRYLGQVLLRRRPRGAGLAQRLVCVAAALATVMAHPVTAWRQAREIPTWLRLIRAGALRPSTVR